MCYILGSRMSIPIVLLLIPTGQKTMTGLDVQQLLVIFQRLPSNASIFTAEIKAIEAIHNQVAIKLLKSGLLT